MLQIAYRTLDDKQGGDIRIIDIREISALTDYFVIVHGNNTSHVQALVEYLTKAFSQEGYPLVQHEGGNHSSWVLLDYGELIVHIFLKEEREFYNLERIWSDGKELSSQFTTIKDN
ncbi:MAG: ribosome silencing factor [Epulopiscium sp.]|nr:ribosome silencing factor [Candidatus Epulonipiscium sp.]